MAMVGNSEPDAWFAEIDLDPAAPWLRMGTRQLGGRPWLVVDDKRDVELALKRRLILDRHDEVFAAEPDADGPGREVLALALAALAEADISAPSDGAALHPLERAGCLIQEDLCLMRREEQGWILAAASLCFPSRWRLADKMGRPLADVHGPVQGYRSELSHRVDALFDRIGARIVWRRNWFVHPDANLFQPDRPPGGDPIIAPEHCENVLILRSERQTMRRLPMSEWVLFTIRIQHEPLGRFLADDERRAAFARFLTEAPPEHAAHRGFAPAQIDALACHLRD